MNGFFTRRNTDDLTTVTIDDKMKTSKSDWNTSITFEMNRGWALLSDSEIRGDLTQLLRKRGN